ncbi:MAG: B12-binding domain-containing radical SAM protein [Candidatus Odinarchaeia archaeon]
MKGGYKIILTADRTMMSSYRGSLFIGFITCGPKTLINPRLLFSFVVPKMKTVKGRVKSAPYGLRKIEAALMDYGFTEEDIIVVNPDNIKKFVGPNTKVIGVSAMDPLGRGPASNTFSGEHGLVKKDAYLSWKFKELIKTIHEVAPNVKIVVGGSGTWQFKEDPEIRNELGLDVVMLGESDLTAPQIFSDIVNGREVPPLVEEKIVPVDKIPIIRNAAVGGVVEITRGCGRGCEFCIPTMRKLRSRPKEDILKEAKVNIEGGEKWITLHGEDVLRYKARGFTLDHDAVVNLFRSVNELEGCKGVGASHFSLAAAAQDPQLLNDIADAVGIGTEKTKPWMGCQTGVETGSVRLIKEYMSGKVRPFKPEEWPDIVEQAFGYCHDYKWVPAATLILGFPNETDDDVAKTIELLDRLRPYKSLIVPLFCVPIAELSGQGYFGTEQMRPIHWEVFEACWAHLEKWLPELARDHTQGMNRIAGWFIRRFVNYAVKKSTKKVWSILEQNKQEAAIKFGLKTSTAIEQTTTIREKS